MANIKINPTSFSNRECMNIPLGGGGGRSICLNYFMFAVRSQVKHKENISIAKYQMFLIEKTNVLLM